MDAFDTWVRVLGCLLTVGIAVAIGVGAVLVHRLRNVAPPVPTWQRLQPLVGTGHRPWPVCKHCGFPMSGVVPQDCIARVGQCEAGALVVEPPPCGSAAIPAAPLQVQLRFAQEYNCTVVDEPVWACKRCGFRPMRPTSLEPLEFEPCRACGSTAARCVTKEGKQA